jgi:hypothetical protein
MHAHAYSHTLTHTRARMLQPLDQCSVACYHPRYAARAFRGQLGAVALWAEALSAPVLAAMHGLGPAYDGGGAVPPDDAPWPYAAPARHPHPHQRLIMCMPVLLRVCFLLCVSVMGNGRGGQTSACGWTVGVASGLLLRAEGMQPLSRRTARGVALSLSHMQTCTLASLCFSLSATGAGQACQQQQCPDSAPAGAEMRPPGVAATAMLRPGAAALRTAPFRDVIRAVGGIRTIYPLLGQARSPSPTVSAHTHAHTQSTEDSMAHLPTDAPSCVHAFVVRLSLSLCVCGSGLGTVQLAGSEVAGAEGSSSGSSSTADALHAQVTRADAAAALRHALSHMPYCLCVCVCLCLGHGLSLSLSRSVHGRL